LDTISARGLRGRRARGAARARHSRAPLKRAKLGPYERAERLARAKRSVAVPCKHAERQVPFEHAEW
jgi:hypothetical protein